MAKSLGKLAARVQTFRHPLDMTWTFSTEVNEYDAAAGPLLRSDAARHTIGVTVIDSARHRAELLDPPEQFAWWTDDDGDVTGCASLTPPWPLLLECVPDEALRPLAEQLLATGTAVAGVNGPNPLAATFASVWRSLTGDRVLIHDVLRLFRLGTLAAPTRSTDGYERAATNADFPLLVDWFTRFGVEVHGPMPRAEEEVAQRMRHGGARLWCDAADQPVSLVAHTPPIADVVRVGPVFTPREVRGRGYAEALTYAVSLDIVGQGLGAVLFTDQSNPTSNGIYTRLGYRPVMDRLALSFEPA